MGELRLIRIIFMLPQRFHYIVSCRRNDKTILLPSVTSTKVDLSHVIQTNKRLSIQNSLTHFPLKELYTGTKKHHFWHFRNSLAKENKGRKDSSLYRLLHGWQWHNTLEIWVISLLFPILSF